MVDVDGLGVVAVGIGSFNILIQVFAVGKKRLFCTLINSNDGCNL